MGRGKAAEKGGFAHFMLKEIYEQPKAVADTISPRIKDNEIVIEELKMTDEEIRNIRRIQMVACGSAYHVRMERQIRSGADDADRSGCGSGK